MNDRLQRAMLMLAASVMFGALAAWLSRPFLPLHPQQASAGPMKSFPNGFPASPDFFPIGVWLQAPERAAQFKLMGINTYMAMSGDATDANLALLERAGMYLVAEQSPALLASRHAGVIKAWMQPDEPDNAQMDAVKSGTPPCLPPEEVLLRSRAIQKYDATRPSLVNYGPGAGDQKWIGRGTCTGDWSWYRKASAGVDIVSFDIYPITSSHKTNSGRLETIHMGVANLIRSVGDAKPVWFIVGTTHVDNETRRPTAQEVKNQVWMAITAGARGIAYFVHEWHPSFSEPGVLRYPEIVEAIKETNGLITNLAPILNGPSVPDRLFTEAKLPLATMVKEGSSGLFVFLANLSAEPNAVTWKAKAGSNVPALDLVSGRSTSLTNGSVSETLPAYGVRVYRLVP